MAACFLGSSELEGEDESPVDGAVDGVEDESGVEDGDDAADEEGEEVDAAGDEGEEEVSVVEPEEEGVDAAGLEGDDPPAASADFFDFFFPLELLLVLGLKELLPVGLETTAMP